ncbi:MAG: pyrimidine-nucleoside phosphorylase, partial [Chloroflexus aggregans]
GNALEVREAVAALRGSGPSDLVELCLVLGSELVCMAGLRDDTDTARALLVEALNNGAAWEKFRAMVANQGGDVTTLDHPDRLPNAPVHVDLAAPRAGFITAIDGQTLGLVVNALGGGRAQKEDTIDHSVGLVLRAKVGASVAVGEPLVTIHAARQSDVDAVAERLVSAYTIHDTPPPPLPLVEEIIR